MSNNIRLAALLIVSAVIGSACNRAANSNFVSNAGNAPGTPGPSPVISRAPDGKELYALNCMICHQENGKGGKITKDGKSFDAEDLTAEKMKKMSDEKLIGYVTNGIEDEGMPAFKDKMTAEEIRAVVAHLRDLQADL